MAKITVLGSGGWGIALAISAYNSGNDVTLWSPFENEVNMLLEKHTNDRLLNGVIIPDGIKITSDMSCVNGSTVTIIATPSTAVREVAAKLAKQKNYGIVVNVAKGLEKGTLNRLSQVIQSVMSSDYLRVYTSTDVIGVELGGALKNVIAIAAGFCDGLGLGDNTKAALITRGLAEMTRLGVCMGACEYTFSGLTGIGDLVVTCTSQHSRNNRFGNKVGRGMAVKQALEEVGTVEGYYAADMAHSLSLKYKIEMPIIEECYQILYEGKDDKSVVTDLMRRPNRSEH